MDLLPRGVRVFPPPFSSKRERLREKIVSVFKRWGFSQVETPVFDYYDDVIKLLDESLKGGTVKVVERETGRLMVLRPDFTVQVARLARTILKDQPRPLRLFYNGAVFRWPINGKVLRKQIYQVGLEIIGLEMAEADAEIVAVARQVFEELGIEDYRISISHMGFVKELIKSLDPMLRKEVAAALNRKDKDRLLAVLSNVHPKTRAKIVNLMDLVGQEDVLDRAFELADTVSLKTCISRLGDVINILKQYDLYDNVFIDLSEVRGLSYHNGIFFEIFIRGTGSRVAVGGRYDELTEFFGKKEPAVGLAIDLDVIFELFENREDVCEDYIDYLVSDFSKTKEKGLMVARWLRNKGKRVARDIIKRSLEDSLDYARRVGIKKVIVITDDLKELGKLRVIDVLKNKDMLFDEERFLNFGEGED